MMSVRQNFNDFIVNFEQNNIFFTAGFLNIFTRNKHWNFDNSILEMIYNIPPDTGHNWRYTFDV